MSVRHQFPISGKHYTVRLMILAALTCLTIVTSTPAIAAPILATPAGLNPGDTFRFVFSTTDTFPSYSQRHADYDAIIAAQAGGATYGGSLVSWKIIGSTGYVQAVTDPLNPQIIISPEVYPISATTHIGVNPSIAGLFVPNGVKVATGDGPTGLWSGSLLAPIDRDINGTQQSGVVFTGTAADGSSYTNNGLGNFAPVIGAVQNMTSSWTDLGTGDYQYNSYRFYGISEVLTVPVPEPTSAGLLFVSMLTAARLRRHRRR